MSYTQKDLELPDDEPMVIIRSSMLWICDGDKYAAAALNMYVHWTKWLMKRKPVAQEINRMLKKQGKTASQDTSYIIYRKQAMLIEDMLGFCSEKTLRRANNFLIEKGLLKIETPRSISDHVLKYELQIGEFKKQMNAWRQQREDRHEFDDEEESDTALEADSPETGDFPSRSGKFPVSERENSRFTEHDQTGNFPFRSGKNPALYRNIDDRVIDDTDIDDKERESTNVSAPTEAADAAAHTRSLPEIENITSEEAELAARMIQERRKQQSSPTSQETTPSSSIESKQKETGKNEKTATKPTRRKTVSKPEASLQAMVILSAWSLIVWGTSDRETPRTKDNLAAAEELARINATENDLRNVRDRLLAQKDGFWTSRGVSLKNIANNFHLAAQGPLSSQAVASNRPAPDTSVPMNHDQACQLAADAVKAAKGQGREIQVQAVSLDNGAWGIVVRWNTTGFEKPETFKTRNRWDGVFKEMCGIWQDETKEKVRKG